MQRTHSIWQLPSQPKSCDVAIVGGGIMGCATAYWLRQFDPSLDVVILEANRLAHGASGRNAGFLLLGTHTDYYSAAESYGRTNARRLWEFTAENARLVSEMNGSAFDLQQVGSTTAAGDDEEAVRLERSATLMAADKISALYLDSLKTDERLSSDGFRGSLSIAEGGMLHPAKLVRYLAKASEATILEDWPVQALESEGEGVLVSGSPGEVRARKVVITVNAYLPVLVPALSSIVRPVRAQMLATEPAPIALDCPVYSHDGYFYLRQRTDGRVLVGGARHLHKEEEVGFDDATTDTLQSNLEAYLKRYFPQFAGLSVERRWSGTMGFSQDSLPVVGGVPDVNRAIFAAGFTGHGMGFGARFGQLLARTVLGEQDEALDLFSQGRFVS